MSFKELEPWRPWPQAPWMRRMTNQIRAGYCELEYKCRLFGGNFRLKMQR